VNSILPLDDSNHFIYSYSYYYLYANSLSTTCFFFRNFIKNHQTLLPTIKKKKKKTQHRIIKKVIKKK